MVRYDNFLRIRMNEEVKNTLRKYCLESRVKESDFVRNSIEKCLVSELKNKGEKPNFPTLYANY